MIAEAGRAAICLAAALTGALALLIATRALGWRRRQITLLVRPWLLAIWILLTIGVSVTAANGLFKPSATESALLACWLVAGMLLHVVDRRGPIPRHPGRRWGARLAHLGIVLGVGGIILSSSLTLTVRRVMAPGDTVKFNAWTLQLHDVWPAAGEDWAGVEAELRASSGRGVVLLKPQQRTRFDGSSSAEPATLRSGSGMLTATIGPRDADGEWPIQLAWTPLLVLIPLGGMIAALGGAVAMVGPSIARRRRLRRARLANAWWA